MKKKLCAFSFCAVVVLSANVCWAAASSSNSPTGGRKRSNSLLGKLGIIVPKSPSSSPKGSPRGLGSNPLQKAIDDLRALEQEITLKFSFAHLYVQPETMINGHVFAQIHDLLVSLTTADSLDELARKPLSLRIMNLYEKAYKGYLKHLGYLKYSLASSEQPVGTLAQETFQVLFNGWLGEGVLDVGPFFQGMRESLEQAKAARIADA
ncbi:hypothetical protein K2W90_05775 [Candidatus Babeliales bacterium]|nr:hypothetical protein [Candidatus Babeliales bacterium]